MRIKTAISRSETLRPNAMQACRAYGKGLYIFFVTALIVGITSCTTLRLPLFPFEFSEGHMGMQVRIAGYAPDEATARRAAGAAFDRIATLEDIMSDFRLNSELTRLNRSAGGPPIPVSPELYIVLERAMELHRCSEGAFDVSAGPLVALWRTARRDGVFPHPDSLRDAAARVGSENIRLNPVHRTVELTKPGMAIDLGGLAKGYILDEAMEALKAHGVDRALVRAGGDIVVSGSPPGQTGWRIMLEHAPPDANEVLLSHAAISTSGDTEQYVEIDGIRYSHIIDPRTGVGLTNRLAVTVVAKDGFTSDGLATAISVLGEEDGAKLAAKYPGVTIYVRQVP